MTETTADEYVNRLSPRISGNPARADGLARFIDWAQQFDDVVFMRRIDIAQSFIDQCPAGQFVSVT